MAQSKGYGQPNAYNAPLGTDTFIFQDDGLVPNSALPLIVRRGAIPPAASDPAKAFETDVREERLDEFLAQRHRGLPSLPRQRARGSRHCGGLGDRSIRR